MPELLRASHIEAQGDVPDLPIRQVTDDSRSVGPETLFIAVKGTKVDGHRLIDEVVERGARVVMVEEDCPVPPSVVKLRVKSTRLVIGPLVHDFLGAPSRRLKMVGVTGTNGKTTVTWLIRHLLESAQIPSGLIGTISYQIGPSVRPSHNTTPGAAELQGMLAEMVDNGLKSCAMEVSSHALDQHRTDGIQWACGVFTNFTPEHLDYHQTLENYLKTKLRLFQDLPSDATAVINRDDPVWERVRKATRASVLTYSLQSEADLSASEIQYSLEKTVCRLKTPQGIFSVVSPLVGRHNLENLLAAVGACLSVGAPAQRMMASLGSFPGVPGRLERIEMGQPFSVFVDYAHTDDALRRVLEHLRILSGRKILLVFGCGGDRDRTKRPRMGRVAVELADRVIVTSDNPRSEDPAAIAREIVGALPKKAHSWEVILDRREAIRAALESAGEDWVVVIAGKGHETGQIVKEQRIPFDDRSVARELLSRIYPLESKAVLKG